MPVEATSVGANSARMTRSNSSAGSDARCTSTALRVCSWLRHPSSNNNNSTTPLMMNLHRLINQQEQQYFYTRTRTFISHPKN